MTLFPRVQPWSDDSCRYRLTKLKPEGLGTYQVESLSSYLTRLASAHWVSPTKLYRALSEEVYKGEAKTLSALSRIDGYSKLSRHVATTLNALSAIEVDFHDLTLNAWSAVFANHGCGLLRDHLAWCCDCYKEDDVRESPLYNRLLWCIRGVSLCPAHNCRLVHSCGACGARQACVTSNAQVGYCQKCGSDLTQQSPKIRKSKPLKEESVWKTAACTELLRTTQSGTQFDRETFLLRFKDCLARYRGSPKRMAKSLNLGLDSIRAWVARGHDPQFGFFLDVCYRLDMPPVQFFLRSGALPINRPRVVRETVEKRAPALTRDELDSARRMVQKILGSAEEIQKLADVAIAAGITVRKLQYHLPKEYSAVVRRIFERRAREKKERDEERIRNLEKRAFSLARRRIYPSQRKILATRIVHSSDLRVPLVRQRLRDIQDEFLEQHPEFKKDAKFMHHLRLSRRRTPTRLEVADQIRLQSAHGRLR